MPGASDLHAMCEDYLSLCLHALADTPAGAPACSYVSSGPPPWDILDCVVVHTPGPVVADTLPQTTALTPGHRVTTNGEVIIVALVATVLRCGYVLDEGAQGIDPAAITAVAAQTNADLWAVQNHLRAAKRAGTLFPPREREFFIDPAVAVNQEGGAAGWQIGIRVQLGGYAIPLGS